MNEIIRAYEATLDVSEGERAVVAKINTASVDRYGTVIEPRGIDLKAFRTNPVVLWEHGQDARGRLPVGRAAWVKYDRTDDSLIAKTIYNDDEFSESVFRCYQNKVLRGYSVNVLPREYSKPTPDEVKKSPDKADAWMVYRSSELAEYSAVSVPGNAEALTLAVSRGLAIPATIMRSLGRLAPPKAPASASAYLDRLGDKWLLRSVDAQVLGEYSTEDEAIKAFEQFENPPVEPELPPLVGRTFRQALDETVHMIRTEAGRVRDDQKAQADLRRGIV